MAEEEHQAKLTDVVVDDVTWRCATRARRTEWLQAIEELIEDGVLLVSASKPATLHAYVSVSATAIGTAFSDSDGAAVGNLLLPRPIIGPMFREYMQLLRAIGGQGACGYSPQIEAMDIARRLMHNDAAELLIRHCVGVLPEQKMARRLFTLFVLLTHDTTKMNAAWPG